MSVELNTSDDQGNSSDRRQNQRWMPNLPIGLPFPFFWSTVDSPRTEPVYMDFDRDFDRVMDQALFPPFPPRARTDSGFESSSGVPENPSLDFFKYEATAPPSTELDREALDRLMMDDLPILLDMPEPSWIPCCNRRVDRPSVKAQEHSTPPTSSPLIFPPVITNYAATPNGHDKFVCSVCKNKYGRRQDCHRHIISAHIKQKTFICPQHGCHGSFCRADVLKRHLRQVHHLNDL